ncbi:MAG: hypothetical protein R3B72_37895 [Polyangiaceae bacterium]
MKAVWLGEGDDVLLVADHRKIPDDLRRYQTSQPGEYRIWIHAVDLTIPYSQLDALYPRLRDAHFAFIEEAGKAGCPFLRYHSRGSTRYVAEVTGEPVPDPPRVEGAAHRYSHYKIAPGSGGGLWPLWRDQGHASIGWNELGDLTGLTREEFGERVAAVREKFPQTTARALKQVWTFSRLRPGDRIVANAGTRKVLGIGTVTGNYELVDDTTAEHRHRIPVRWDDVEPKAVEKPGWQRTIIKLKATEFNDIATGATTGGEPPLAPEADPDAFSDLLDAIEAGGFYFPPEIVANYLLALQTKRFVILTGISGTGKTQLALQVAKYFVAEAESAAEAGHARAPAAEREVGSVVVTVKPSMVKYGRMVVPADLATEFLSTREERSDSRWLPIELPDGQQLDIVAHTREGTNLLYALFRGAAREWLQGQPIGARLQLSRLEEPEPVGRLRFRALDDATSAVAPRSTYALIPVRPDWNDSTGLFGFHNPLTGHYTTRAFLRLALDAIAEAEAAREADRDPEPFFAILDEMNLARVEHYFSDVLSAMESGEPIELHEDDAVAAGETPDGIAIPKELRLPDNLFVVGTVNVDETTYMFSPKVLDRAFTIEFNDVALEGYGVDEGAYGLDESSHGLDASPDDRGRTSTPLALEAFSGPLRSSRRPGASDWQALGELDARHRHLVVALNQLLAKDNRHFGYRVANEIGRFVTLAHEQSGGSPEAAAAALDLAVLQKVLPKLHGTQQELEDILVGLLTLASGRGDDGAIADDELLETAPTPELTPPLPRTALKLQRMLRRVRQQGFVSFIE